jgi:menaquinol-cytochrome c reductase iron-sulfur subunit
MSHDPSTPPADPPDGDRRGFLTKALCCGLGGVAAAIPAAAGLGVLLDPLSRKSDASGTLARIATLDSLPIGDKPQLFPVIATRVDAWNRTTAPVGAVYVRRTGEKTLQVFHTTCPHAGCAVEFREEKQGYFCPCHDSTFSLEGRRSEQSPAARDLDELEYEIRENGEIWVRFQNYLTGHKEKVPVA